MAPRPHRRLTNPQWLLRYTLNNPRTAAMYLALAALVVLVVTLSLAIEAIPVWLGSLVAGLALIAVAREPFRRARLLWTADEQPVDSLSDGVVAVSGTVVAPTDKRLSSAVEGVDCLGYEATKTRKKPSSREGTTKRTKQRALPFCVEDDTGRVLVDATTGTLSLQTDAETKSGSTTRTEELIREGDQVTVYGEVVNGAPGSVLDGPTGVDLGVNENRLVTAGPAYGDAVVTNTGAKRLLASQLLYALGWAAVGGLLVAVSVVMAAGIYTP